ncbi:hypothetical protein SAMN02910292_02849 [Lachnospiraceae bacterium XBB2008]|nr:hypothetical protein SAMN02910292_02849 [Lachnospiraceae bacterium XBB2008]
MKPIEFLKHYRSNPDFYLPMIDHEKKPYPKKVPPYGDINIGWDCGAIGRRPYFVECWSGDHVTMVTFYISTLGIENYSVEALEKLLIVEASLYFPKVGYRKPGVAKLVDSYNNEFFLINIVVGIEDEDSVIVGPVIYPFSRLNELNGYSAEGET